MKGIEPSYSAWKAAALPLSYTRNQSTTNGRCRIRTYVGVSHRIYSPTPLATRATFRCIDYFGCCPWSNRPFLTPKSRREDLNPRPADYKSAALPLSYTGNFSNLTLQIECQSVQVRLFTASRIFSVSNCGRCWSKHCSRKQPKSPMSQPSAPTTSKTTDGAIL